MGAFLSAFSGQDGAAYIRDQYRDFSIREIEDQLSVFQESAEGYSMLDEDDCEDLFGTLFGDVNEHFEFWKEEAEYSDDNEVIYEVCWAAKCTVRWFTLLNLLSRFVSHRVHVLCCLSLTAG